jgi:hypothetical protein
MTYNIKNLNVASLDFDDIVASLSTFLQQQPELSDVNFTDEGTAANMLVQILATSTAYSGVYAQFGYINSWPVTANFVEGVLASASLSSILIPYTQSASCVSTLAVTGIMTDVPRYTTFNGQSTTGTPIYFYNVDPIIRNNGTGNAYTLYCGSGTVVYTNYDYTTQSCIIPKTVDPRTISMYTTKTDVSGTVTYWTRVEKGNNTSSSNQNIFTVTHAPDGNYLVTNNLPNAAKTDTSVTVSIQAVVSNGVVGNSATVVPPSYLTQTYQTTPDGGYDELTLGQAKAKYTFNANGLQRCVTLNDYKNAILASGISGTSDFTLITVANGSPVGTVKIYVSGLSVPNQATLMNYLSSKAMAGINLVYSL